MNELWFIVVFGFVLIHALHTLQLDKRVQKLEKTKANTEIQKR
jgi:hypothetical protein